MLLMLTVKSPAMSYSPACRYQHYLESVLEASEGYHEVGDLIARQTTLDSTHADLETRLGASAAAAEAVR